MPSPYSKLGRKSKPHRERGIAMPMLAAMFLAILAMLGLAVDGARLFHGKQALQAAADAAAIGVTYLIINAQDQAERAALLDIAKHSVIDNLKSNSFDVSMLESQIQVSLVPNSLDPRGLQVSGPAPVDLWIMRFLPGFNDRLQVSAISSTLLKNIALTLVVDISDSMAAPTDCDLGPLACIKFDKLKEGVLALIDELPSFAYFSLVTFAGDVATVQYPMTLNPAKSELNTIVNNFAMTNGTPMASALVEARKQFERVNLASTDGGVAIVISDGAPNRSAGISDVDDCEYDTVFEEILNDDGLDSTTPDSGKIEAQHYLKSLREADALRALGITVHFLAIGNRPVIDPDNDTDCEPALAAADPAYGFQYRTTDFFQCLIDPGNFHVKDFFGVRLANTIQSIQNGDTALGIPVSPLPPSCIAPTQPGFKQGIYSASSNIDTVNATLATLGKTIRGYLTD